MLFLCTMKDLTQLNEAVEMVFEHFGIDKAAFVIAFTEKSMNYKKVYWVSNTSRMGSIRLLEDLAEKMRSQLN